MPIYRCSGTYGLIDVFEKTTGYGDGTWGYGNSDGEGNGAGENDDGDAVLLDPLVMLAWQVVS